MSRLSDARIAAIAVTAFTFVVTALACFSPYWLASERRLYGTPFDKLGLWMTCFRSLHAKEDLEHRKYYSGCRFLFAVEYQNIRDDLMPAFFIITEIFYGIAFLTMFAAVIVLLALQVCKVLDNHIQWFKRLSLMMFVSAIFATLAVIVFGIKGDDPGWMPDPDHNFLSWAFALAVVGAFFSWIAAVLFSVEQQILIKKELKQEGQEYQMEAGTLKV